MHAILKPFVLASPGLKARIFMKMVQLTTEAIMADATSSRLNINKMVEFMQQYGIGAFISSCEVGNESASQFLLSMVLRLLVQHTVHECKKWSIWLEVF
jgi:hypothetical protein